ncbi:MAG: hypothetical protein JSS49_15905 [Planctomycetes bacterium]|nr:hypothetical protein [Planctomycetota bacterium]
MQVFFVMPLVVSIVAASYMACISEAHAFWRIFVVILVLASAALQMIDLFAMMNVHFLIPLLIQIIVSIGVFFWGTWEQSEW